MDRISALMDGELDRNDAVRLVSDIRQGEALREAWATYHLIGEALRNEPCIDCNVAQAVSVKLTLEPTVLAPRRFPIQASKRWALPSMAAAAAVATVTWMAAETQQGGLDQPVAIPASHMVVPAVAVSSPIDLPYYAQAVSLSSQSAAPVAIQFPARAYEDYLMAHQEFSPSTTLQGLAPYVRTVTSGAVETGR